MSTRTSSSSRFEAWSQIMPFQCKGLPSRATPLRRARAISLSLQAPMPAVGSGVRLRVQCDPAGNQLIFCPPLHWGRDSCYTR